MTIKIMKKSVSVKQAGDVKDFASSCIPVVLSNAKESDPEKPDGEEYYNIFPLASSRYRYSKWHDLDEMTVSSDMLHCPRVRKGPKGFKMDTIWMLEDQEKSQIHEEPPDSSLRNILWRKKKKKLDFQSKLENWEQCECVNLSYQDLGHAYQAKEFLKVLRKLVRAERIELIDNGLSDLSSVFFPRCKCLYLQRNFLSNLKKLPQLPSVEHVSLQQNNISKLDGLECLRQSKLTSLVLQDNPVALDPDYRQRVFNKLPNLRLLDGMPRLPSDDIALVDKDRGQTRTCNIS